MAGGDEHYHPKDAIKAAIQGTMITGAAGGMVSAIQNTLTKQRNVSGWGVFTRTGGTIAVFAAMGGTYEFAKFASANLREKDDTYNTAIGGFLAGGVLGLRFGTPAAVLGYGALAGIVLSAYEFTGAQLPGRGLNRDGEDEFERKQWLRKNRRRPIEQTIEEIGEGRGVYAPGYAERRAQRIKETYGIDVPSTA